MFALRRFVATVRPLTTRQIATRALRVLQRHWRRVRRSPAPCPAPPPIRSHRSLWEDREPDAETIARARVTMEGTFDFLNVVRRDPSWNEPGVSQLWRFHLHYFGYLRDLATLTATPERAEAFACFRHLAGDWIASNDVLSGDGWHPYPTSLRIVNWCEAIDAFATNLAEDAAFARAILSSLNGQARFLSRHLEHDVRGNHLVKNARALIWAGVFFDGTEAVRWREKGLRLLRDEVSEQILEDGGHFERVPGYHVQVLNDLAETAEYLRRNDLAQGWLDEAVARMRRYLAAVTPPDARLPLFKDTAAMSVAPSRDESRFLEASGYAVMRDDDAGDFLMADFGRVCPDYLPAHAHADMFSFELTIGGRPVIVDSGVYEYEAGPWRTWFRSTAAHNTVEIDGRDQSDMWGSFRVGRRAHPSRVTWSEHSAYRSIAGEHDGYAPLIHHRIIAALRNERAWIVIDRVSGVGDHIARSRVHFHPDAPAPFLVPFGASRIEEEDGWYSDSFGSKRRNRVLVLEAKTPAHFGYFIAAEERAHVDLEALLRLFG